jgi:sugar-specific transcriptional regulator TrmB
LIENKDITTLVKLGLTVNQAKIYLSNLKSGIATAKKIAEYSKISTQDTYRVLKSLQKLGIVEKQLSSPTLFKAISIKKTITNLLKQKKIEYDNLQIASVDLTKKQEYIKKVIKDKEKQYSRFLIISGKKAIFAKSNQVISKATKSACISTLWESGSKGVVIFADLVKKALERGVKFRFIINIPLDQKNNFLKKIVKDYATNPFVEYRFMERDPKKKHLVFSIFDDNDGLFSIKEASLGESPLLWSNNKQFIELVQNAFEFLWHKAILA